MEVNFANHDLRKLCEDHRYATRNLGTNSAKKLNGRVADLFAANNVRELVAGRPHPLKGDRAGEFSVSLSGGHRLVFTPANQPIPLKPDGSISWSDVTSVLVVYMGDYHD